MDNHMLYQQQKNKTTKKRLMTAKKKKKQKECGEALRLVTVPSIHQHIIIK